MASESSTTAQPVLSTVDISNESSVLHIATTLRRLWLVDPSSPVLATKLEAAQNGEHDHSNCEGHDHDHDHDHDHSHAHNEDDNEDAHSADLEHDHANCSGHDHNHSHTAEDPSASSDDGHGSDCDCGEDHDENDPQLQIFPIAFETVASHIGDASPEDKYLDAKWKSATDLQLKNPPAGAPFTEESTESDDEDAIQSSLFTPFRQQIYGIYNHVFYHAFTKLKEDKVAVAEFKPPSTTVMVLEAPDEEDKEGIPHDFETDTFVYPVWIAEGAKLRLSFGGRDVEVGAEGEKWTEVLMFKAGSQVTIVPEAVGGGELGGGVVALLAMGICEGEGGEA